MAHVFDHEGAKITGVAFFFAPIGGLLLGLAATSVAYRFCRGEPQRSRKCPGSLRFRCRNSYHPTIAGPDLEAEADEFDEPEQDRRDGGAGSENARRPSERPALLVTPARFERATLRFEV